MSKKMLFNHCINRLTRGRINVGRRENETCSGLPVATQIDFLTISLPGESDLGQPRNRRFQLILVLLDVQRKKRYIDKIDFIIASNGEFALELQEEGTIYKRSTIDDRRSLYRRLQHPRTATQRQNSFFNFYKIYIYY